MNKITSLFNIDYPIIQAGMIWCSGWKLASAVSNAGGLGLIGAGSMYPDILREHIRKCKKATQKPFGVNVPLLYPQTDKLIQIIIEEGVKIVFTSAGNPGKYTAYLKEHDITVTHVVANLKFAQKAIDAGVNALVAEGFEAGGHNGFEETTSMVLIPLIREMCNLPLIAAGGIATGSAVYAAMSLGADGVQMGSRFVASKEASAHVNFKQQVIASGDGDTYLTLKQIAPVRLIRNEFFKKVRELEMAGAPKEKIAELLGRSRAKKGMFEGDTKEGELEIGQVAGLLHEVLPVKNIMENLITEFTKTAERMKTVKM